MKPALLVIDVQQGLCEGVGAAFDCAGTIARINQLSRAARAAGVPVALEIYRGVVHGFITMARSIPEALQLREEAGAALRAAFAR